MIAVGTNVVVRFLVRDDRRQAARARRLFSDGDVFIPLQVQIGRKLSRDTLLSFEWSEKLHSTGDAKLFNRKFQVRLGMGQLQICYCSERSHRGGARTVNGMAPEQ